MGVLKVGPGAINSVPRSAEMEIDVRDIDGERRDIVVGRRRLTPSRPLVDRAYFQSLKLNCDEPLSNLAFNFNLRRDIVVAKIVAKSEEIAARRHVRWNYQMINADPPAGDYTRSHFCST